MTDAELPFLVHGTPLPGERDHDRFLRDRFLRERTAGGRPAALPGALLHAGPGSP